MLKHLAFNARLDHLGVLVTVLLILLFKHLLDFVRKHTEPLFLVFWLFRYVQVADDGSLAEGALAV